LKSIKAIACAFASALAVLVFTFALLGPHASAQTSTDYTPSSVGAGNQSQGNVGGNVATTGSDSTIPLTTLGIGLVTAGGVAIALARRRRVAAATA
jgi:LPXTG-motif cell wall-anchored protein